VIESTIRQVVNLRLKGASVYWKESTAEDMLLLRCLYKANARLRIRDRSKNLKATFFEMGERVWQVYHSDTRRIMSQRIRRLSDWAKKNLSDIVLAKTLDLCAKRAEWSLWYDYPNAYRTSNELDHLMRSQIVISIVVSIFMVR